MESNVSEALKRAKSRAAVLHSLGLKYSAPSSSSVASTGTAASAVQSMKKGAKDSIDIAVRSIMECIAGAAPSSAVNKLKAERFFRDNLRGKAINTENTKRQMRAMKKSYRSAAKRRQLQYRISGKERKRRALQSDCVKTMIPSDVAVRILHDSHWEYLAGLVRQCKSEMQLQRRLHSAELVGARVHIVEYMLKPSLVGRCGIITAISANSFLILADDERAALLRKQHQKERIQNNAAAALVASNFVLRIVKEQTVLAVELPSIQHDSAEAKSEAPEASHESDEPVLQWDANVKRTGSGRWCLIYGNKMLPHCDRNDDGE